ncbi:lipid A deacylase LpxR family protein [Flavobacterium wongokense]|uniref:lipid A deacylase LpxR family protein n=1 Tax=Flavobacterium wongokense TaxID=2910674 RepID=UPI001F3398E4|nr:lipid A deacylase LpxR family protein [Flavobacterium sp. WG47]MCF6132585.1 lipid A deacylase LpxR family protein [Flavobacterium sp. WG47]
MEMLRPIMMFLLFIPMALLGQKIDNTASFRDIKSQNYIRINYDNDFFTLSDFDYTQGISLELVDSWLKKNPVNYLLISPKQSETRFGLAIEHIVYTPDTLDTYQIQYGQRPFAAAFMVKSFAIATDTIHKSRIVSSLSLGLIGQGAGGGNMQKIIHQITGSETPNGWYYQIRNDLVLNYDLSYEKQLLRLNDFFSLQFNGGLKVGTLFTNASLGLNASLGIINSPFTAAKSNTKFQVYLYNQALVNAIGYDATLQGGIFNNDSPYTIPNSDIERFTLQDNLGIVLQFNRFYLEYVQTFLTREISTAKAHDWGGMRVGYKF